MLRDELILSRKGHITVLAEAHEVQWRDGDRLQLHAVRWGDDRSTFLRALPYGGQWLIFDLRDVCPASLEREAAAIKGGDALGLSIYALRRYHDTLQGFLRVASQFVRVGWPIEDGHAPCRATTFAGPAFQPTTAGVFHAAR